MTQKQLSAFFAVFFGIIFRFFVFLMASLLFYDDVVMMGHGHERIIGGT